MELELYREPHGVLVLYSRQDGSHEVRNSSDAAKYEGNIWTRTDPHLSDGYAHAWLR